MYYKNRKSTQVSVVCCSSGVNIKKSANLGDAGEGDLPDKAVVQNRTDSHNVTNITYNITGGAVENPAAMPTPGAGFPPSQTVYPSNVGPASPSPSDGYGRSPVTAYPSVK